MAVRMDAASLLAAIAFGRAGPKALSQASNALAESREAPSMPPRLSLTFARFDPARGAASRQGRAVRAEGAGSRPGRAGRPADPCLRRAPYSKLQTSL
ncbi:MAG: hypothetical protein LBQ12_08765 [Deltaproteobacteria bacterium]|nr:hypothetical protein [Deltaproteobacteria bacterium]